MELRIKLNTPMDNNIVPSEKTNINFDDLMMVMLKKSLFENLVKEKKLLLVLDLDHTLLHSRLLTRLTRDDRDLIIKETDDPKNSSNLFQIKFNETHEFVIKLRPGLRQFLEEASKLYQLHVFTKGGRDYAMKILKRIDPDDVYFGSKSASSVRIITRESCVGGKKHLDLVMGKENGILIVDDEKKVWRDVDMENVLEIPKYEFFRDGKKLSEGVVEGRDESEAGESLITCFRVLKVVHAMFFDPIGEGDVLERDVRVLKNKVDERCEGVEEQVSKESTKATLCD